MLKFSGFFAPSGHAALPRLASIIGVLLPIAPCGQIRSAIGAATINPDLLTAAERIQYEGYLRREDINAAILGQAKAGTTIKEIVRRTGYSRGLVRQVLRGQHSDVFRVRESSLELYLPWLDAQWATGMAENCGDSSNAKGSVAAFGSLPSGLHAVENVSPSAIALAVADPISSEDGVAFPAVKTAATPLRSGLAASLDCHSCDAR